MQTIPNIDGLARHIARKVAIRFASNRLSLTAKEQKMANVRASYKWKRATLSADVTASTMEELFNASRAALLSEIVSRSLERADFDAIKAGFRFARAELERFHGASLHEETTLEEVEWHTAQREANKAAGHESERATDSERLAKRCEHAKECIIAFWHASTSRKKASALAADLARINKAMALFRAEIAPGELMGAARAKSTFWMEWQRLAARIAEGEKLLTA